jgi:hypothetical protein
MLISCEEKLKKANKHFDKVRPSSGMKGLFSVHDITNTQRSYSN